jgi:hypothetical protein
MDWPALYVPSAGVLLIFVTVGATESYVRDSWDAAVEGFPALSLATAAARSTVTRPSADGKICATYDAPVPDKLETEPFPTVISPWAKSVTDSLNVILTGIGDVFVGLETVVESVTVGAVVSITILLPPPKDEAFARAGNVNVALAPPPLVIVPPFTTRAVVERYCRSDEV